MAGLELAILVGLQAAGKSTFARRRFGGTHEYVSKDLLRSNRRPGRRQAQLVAAALAAGRSVVVDNTNPTREERAELIGLGRAHGVTVAGYLFPPDVPASRARNSLRLGRERVPDVAIYATAKRFQPPAPEEGFDALYRVRISGEGTFAVEPWQEEAGRAQR